MYVEFPDAEIAAIDSLRLWMPDTLFRVDAPDGYDVTSEPLVLLSRAGGQPKYPVADQPVFDVFVYAATRDIGSATLARVLASFAAARYDTSAPYSWGQMGVITGPQYTEDPVTGDPRWHAMISMYLRAKRS